MKRLVKIVEPHHVIFPNCGGLSLKIFVELGKELLVSRLRCPPDRFDFQPGANQHAFADILRADQGNETATLGKDVDQAFCGQSRDCLVDGCP